MLVVMKAQATPHIIIRAMLERRTRAPASSRSRTSVPIVPGKWHAYVSCGR